MTPLRAAVLLVAIGVAFPGCSTDATSSDTSIFLAPSTGGSGGGSAGGSVGGAAGHGGAGHGAAGKGVAAGGVGGGATGKGGSAGTAGAAGHAGSGTGGGAGKAGGSAHGGGGGTGGTGNSAGTSAAGGHPDAGGGGASSGGSPPMGAGGMPMLPTCACYFGNGAYCGHGVNDHGKANACQSDVAITHPDDVLDCKDGVWSVGTACTDGCFVAPPMVSDGCNAAPGGYHAPWQCGASYPCTQGNHGDICGSNGGDHTGVQDYDFDFGLPLSTPVLAMRAGTVTVAAENAPPGSGCHDGCPQPFGTAEFTACCNSCLNTANFVNVDHGDGTVATYWHFNQVTVAAGQGVKAGEQLGLSGTSGCSSGPHLHVQLMGDCPTGYCQSIPLSFAEAGVPACGASVTSQNCP